MKAYRYMSLKELQKLSAGCTITGKRCHHAHTTGSGVFFLPETCTYHPEEFLLFLSGIVTDDVMVEFEVNCPVTESHGCYADPYGGWYDMVIIDEICVPQYDRDSMIPIRYYIPARWLGDSGDWYTFN